MIAQQGYPWLLLTYALYTLAFLCWAPVVHLQIRIRNMAKDALTTNTPLPVLAHKYFRIWFALGWPAFIALTGIFWLMVNRPDLWASPFFLPKIPLPEAHPSVSET